MLHSGRVRDDIRVAHRVGTATIDELEHGRGRSIEFLLGLVGRISWRVSLALAREAIVHGRSVDLTISIASSPPSRLALGV